MAVTGSRKVSVLDSYLDDNHSSASRRFINNEMSTTPTSFIRKMWQDLESEGRIRENGKCKMSENAAIVNGPESPHSSYLESESIESDYTSMDVNEIDNESPHIPNENQIASEKERVRKIFLDWGTKSFKGHNRCCTSRINSCTSRAQWVGENEHKRVRIVREWIESSTQQGDIGQTGSDTGQTRSHAGQTGSDQDGTVDTRVGAPSSIRKIYGRQALLDLLAKFKNERKQEVDNLLENRFVSNFGHRHRIQVLLKARFLRNPTVLEVEKQPNVAVVEQGMPRPTHSVSDIRKGFLSRISNYSHAAEGTQSDSDTSSDSEMSYNRTKQSDKFVECFENTSLTNNSKSHNQPQFTSIAEKHVNLLQNEEREELPLTVSSDHFNCDPSSSKNEKKHRVGEESDEKFQEVRDEIGEEQDEIGEERDEIFEEQDEIYNIEMSRETLSTEFIRSGHIPEEEDVNNDDETIRSDFQESHEEWFDNDNDNILVDPTESWYGRTSYMEAALLDRSNAFNASDDDNGRKVELRELTNRGRVSNLLQSDFGARLNQLMRSYVARQDQEFESENEWMMDEDQQSLDENEDGSEVVDTEGEANTHISDFHENLNFVSERDIINGLRVDMDTLKQRMDDMQKMMEACMTMQHELQRSVQQEVYSALNRSSNSGDGIWNHQFETKSVKEEVCYLCCDDDGDESLPNRSVHMYICSQCADKINWSKLKETVRHS